VHLAIKASLGSLAPFAGGFRARPKRVRGSALLATLCFAGVLALAVSGYLAVCYRTLVVSNREINYSHSIELAEMGMDEAIWALNNNNSSGDWAATGWTLSGSTATKTMGDPTSTGPFKYEGKCSGVVKIKIVGTTSVKTNSQVSSIGVMTLGDLTVVTRGIQSKADLAQVFPNTVGALGAITLSAAGQFDSYDSSLGSYIAPDPAHLTPANSAAVLSATSIDIGSAQIYGFAATNGTTLQNLMDGRVIGPNTPSATHIDAGRVSSHSSQPIYDTIQPIGSDPLTLPAVVDSSVTLDTSGVYHVDRIDLGHDAILTISAPVVLKVRNSVHTSDTGQIVVTNTGSLQMQIDEQDGSGLDLQGGGIVNQSGLPQNVSIIVGRMYSGDSNSAIGTPEAFYGSIYLPNDSLNITGDLTFFGAVVAKNVTFSGNPQFHFDLALRNNGISSLERPYVLAQLRELTAAEVATLMATL